MIIIILIASGCCCSRARPSKPEFAETGGGTGGGSDGADSGGGAVPSLKRDVFCQQNILVELCTVLVLHAVLRY